MSTDRDDLTDEPFLEGLRADLARQFAYDPSLGTLARVRIALTHDGIWAMAVYRLGRALRGRRKGPGSRLAWMGYRAGELLVRLVSGIHLDVDSRIGPGFYIGHFSAIHVGPGVTFGAHCSIGQMCFVGGGGAEAPAGVPTVGDRVYLGVGAKVLGGVRIGDGAAVGANAVVLQDIPPNALVIGNPGRVISYKGSGDFLVPGRAAPATAPRDAGPNVVANRVANTVAPFGPADGRAPEADGTGRTGERAPGPGEGEAGQSSTDGGPA